MSAPISTTSPMGQAFAELAPSAVAEMGDALRGTSAAIREARSAWSLVESVPTRILDLLDGSREAGGMNPIVKLKQVLTDARLTDEGKAEAVDGIVTKLGTDVYGLAAQLTAGLDTIEQRLRAAALPPRPTGAESALLIAAAKQDVRMVLDPIDSPAQALNRATDLLSRALGDRDDATAWTLTSPWLRDYFRARGWDEHADAAIEQNLGAVLDQHGGPAVQDARRALAAVTSPHAGLALRTLVPQLRTIVAGIDRQARLAARG